MEATPGYVYGGERIASAICQLPGPVKIIIILKEPVERLISFYQRKKTTFQLPEDITFRGYVQSCLKLTPEELTLKENHLFAGVSYGCYDECLEPWLKTFGSNLKIVFFDDLKNDSANFMKELATWLEIDAAFYDDFNFDVKNKSHDYRNKILHKLVVSANKTGQRFWRSNPGLKKLMLDTYYKINGSPVNKNELDAGTISALRDYYHPHNERLHNLMTQYGYKNFPIWLRPVKELV